MELLLELLIEFAGELLLELGLDFGMSAVKAVAGRKSHHAVLATLGYLLLGGALGGLLVWIVPFRVVAPGPLRGLSLLASPLAAGAVMHVWGAYRRERGHRTTKLATFYGGAAFAFGVSLVRFLFVG